MVGHLSCNLNLLFLRRCSLLLGLSNPTFELLDLVFMLLVPSFPRGHRLLQGVNFLSNKVFSRLSPAEKVGHQMGELSAQISCKRI